MPQFQVYGYPGALFERNHDMANAADRVEVFWDGKSHGTLEMIKYCYKIGRECNIHLFEFRD